MEEGVPKHGVESTASYINSTQAGVTMQDKSLVAQLSIGCLHHMHTCMQVQPNAGLFKMAQGSSCQ
jgi:hypothetical protein